jgi:enterochelin esterase-like enzyme
VIHFYSEALRRETDYLVYLPLQYRRTRPLPVFYMLHGMPGRPLAFTVDADVELKLDALIHEHLVRPMILVFPDGRIGGHTQTDSEWANTPSGRFESYVVDVLHNVDRRFATLPFREDRAIAGLSAGAYGALNVGLHQVARFGLIQVWSGYFKQTRTGVFAHATHQQLAYNSPVEYVHTMRRTLAHYPLRAFLYIGRDEQGWRYTPLMSALLRSEGSNAHYAVYPGGHSWRLWSPHVNQMLIMASHYFASAKDHARRG